ncbi:MAG: hypothetical protein CMB28_02360 [Euryarchaeota archaeon]|nr:hypothetical protein [Euryarchaeota archaeon]
MRQAWILRYGELGLKSKVVRRQFQRALSNNMENLAINSQISLIQTRIKSMEAVTSDSTPEDVENLLCHILGLVAIDPAKVISDAIDPYEVARLILESDELRGQKRTFGVRTKRIGANANYSSQEYSKEIGSCMCEQDESLSVNLTNPDIWVRLILEPDRVWQLGERIVTAGGLPPGVQGDVLCRVTDEESLLSTFLIMRRGSRVIPVEGSDENLVQILRMWDPFIGRKTAIMDLHGKVKQRHPWGVIGITVEDGESMIRRRASDVKTVPLSTLEPLCGWTNSEIEALSKHIRNPIRNPCMPNLDAWVS